VLDHTHDPGIESWVESANGHPDFPIQNLPFGVFDIAHRDGAGPRGGVRIGDEVLDLRAMAGTGLLTGTAQVAANAASAGTLNGLFGLGGESALVRVRPKSEAVDFRGAFHDRLAGSLVTSRTDPPRVDPRDLRGRLGTPAIGLRDRLDRRASAI